MATMGDSGMVGVDDKAVLRGGIRAGRHSRPKALRLTAGAAIASNARDLPLPEQLGSLLVTCYLSLPTEPDTAPLIGALLGRGASVLVPRVSGRELDWLLLADGQQMSLGPFGIPEPMGEAVGRGGAPLADCAALFIPALAVDARGYRLGQGGGFYDRVLADLPDHARGGPMRVALVFEDEIRPRVPSDDHDCRVDLALTEAGIHRFPAR